MQLNFIHRHHTHRNSHRVPLLRPLCAPCSSLQHCSYQWLTGRGTERSHCYLGITPEMFLGRRMVPFLATKDGCPLGSERTRQDCEYFSSAEVLADVQLAGSLFHVKFIDLLMAASHGRMHAGHSLDLCTASQGCPNKQHGVFVRKSVIRTPWHTEWPMAFRLLGYISYMCAFDPPFRSWACRCLTVAWHLHAWQGINNQVLWSTLLQCAAYVPFHSHKLPQHVV
jgi:hypothetical protein